MLKNNPGILYESPLHFCSSIVNSGGDVDQPNKSCGYSNFLKQIEMISSKRFNYGLIFVEKTRNIDGIVSNYCESMETCVWKSTGLNWMVA